MRTICVVTGSRAEFGLLRPLLDEIVAGGYAIAAEVDMHLTDTTPVAVARSMALGLTGMADAFAGLAPDVVVLLGDRFEILTAAAAHPEHVVMRTSLQQRLYLGAMAQAGAVVGISSSGVIEAPILGVPTVNIGARQKGRLRTSSIIDCAAPIWRACAARPSTTCLPVAGRDDGGCPTQSLLRGATRKYIT